MITAGSKKEAEKIKDVLLAEKLVACVNIISGIKSYFWWKGKIDSCPEVLLLAKTQRKIFPGIVRAVKKVHSYEVPEIIALPIIAGSQDYLDWLTTSCV
ncbi:MAG: divalent-cation tolerance protein CutA [Candidatus Omnitrophota bacterium]